MRKTLLSLTLATMIVGAIATPGAAQVQDAWITMKTKIALMTSEGVSATGLNVDTHAGVVTLHGKVASDPEKKKAEAVAKTIDGVKDVKNLLQVVPPSAERMTDVRDDDLKKHVEGALEANRALAASGISVASVNNGVVLLTGKADSLEVHLRAIEATYAVKGVRRVSSDVVVTERKG
ncbi:MAG: BON domain-containing protein [Vicinamibacterales bacterium]